MFRALFLAAVGLLIQCNALPQLRVAPYINHGSKIAELSALPEFETAPADRATDHSALQCQQRPGPQRTTLAPLRFSNKSFFPALPTPPRLSEQPNRREALSKAGLIFVWVLRTAVGHMVPLTG